MTSDVEWCLRICGLELANVISDFRLKASIGIVETNMNGANIASNRVWVLSEEGEVDAEPVCQVPFRSSKRHDDGLQVAVISSVSQNLQAIIARYAVDLKSLKVLKAYVTLPVAEALVVIDVSDGAVANHALCNIHVEGVGV